MEERVQKLMAQANVGSRRTCEEYIIQKRVKVNGRVITLGAKADPNTDVIEVDGVRLNFEKQRKIYIALNKPKFVLTTTEAEANDRRTTVRELIPLEGHLVPVGRLDFDSEGLVVLTNDGEMVQRLTHPSYRHTKTYKVVVAGLPSAETIRRWETGVYLDEGKTGPCTVKIIKGDQDESTLRIIMTEGKKRHIRRVGEMLGHPVKEILRTYIGQLGIGSLRPGEWRELTAADVRDLQNTSTPTRRSVSRTPTRRTATNGAMQDTDRPARPARRSPRAEGAADTDRPRTSNRPPRDGDSSDRPARRSPRAEGAADTDRPRTSNRPPRDGDSSDRPARRSPRAEGAADTDRTRTPSRPPRDGDSSDRPARRSPRAEGAADTDRTRTPSRPPRDGDRPARRSPRAEGATDTDRPRTSNRPPRDGDRPARRSPRAEGAADSDRPRTSNRPPRPPRDGDSDDRPGRPPSRTTRTNDSNNAEGPKRPALPKSRRGRIDRPFQPDRKPGSSRKKPDA